MHNLKLMPIQRGGILAEATELPADAAGALEATAALYERVGHSPPWICYIASEDGRPVGTCGFTSAPVEGRVELAYFTFAAFEGRGIATKMAAQLLALAAGADPAVTVLARTLIERNASHRVLEKLGFTCVGKVESAEDGTVLEWHMVK
jgi:RimJ/RimL family protein N-acetyltransferase